MDGRFLTCRRGGQKSGRLWCWVSPTSADRSGPAWGDGAEGPLVVRAAWKGLLLPFLWVQVFFKIHALKLTNGLLEEGRDSV